MFKKIIQKIFSKFYNQSEIDKIDDLPSKDEHLCSISFSLTKDYDIDIIGSFPNFDDMSTKEIGNIGEKYSQLLLSVNSGIFSAKIIDILENRHKESDDHREQLFIQNTIIFYNLFKEEITKIHNSDQPIISPSAVFNTK